MKKFKNLVVLMILAVMLSVPLTSFAASGSSGGQVTLKPSSTTVNAGEEFNVMVSATCSDGIIGFEANLSYDDDSFELDDVISSGQWIYLGTGTHLDAMANQDITSDNVFVLNFSALNVASSTTGEIKLTNIKMYKTYDEILEIPDQAININVTSGEDNPAVTLANIEITNAPSKTTYTAGEKFSPNGMVVTAVYSDNTSKTITDYIYTPNGTLSTSDRVITISYTENGVTRGTTLGITVNPVTTPTDGGSGNGGTQNGGGSQNTPNGTDSTRETEGKSDPTTTASTLPKTGTTMGIVLVLAVVAIGAGVVLYKKCIKYKDI